MIGCNFIVPRLGVLNTLCRQVDHVVNFQMPMGALAIATCVTKNIEAPQSNLDISYSFMFYV